ncbi:hypothetical protein BDV27DRAFT_157630 [Aspergillus caelatus]|uniref:Uncharacterized protein n=1 Tax=Aspergillus caelatus TaxID=61420 RepID=A0A5N7A4E7_9EURO|nr:uncharacterized protein BDV27DRAFT_157630 [Aspergillus caelatus]KAE8364682.1 hypothetical protein BDV27DRAFT_157630 [Aspergillus caelatus]
MISAGDILGDTPTPAESSSGSPPASVSSLDVILTLLGDAEYEGRSCDLDEVQVKRLLEHLRPTPQPDSGGSSPAISASHGDPVQLEFLCRVGDYAGRLWNCLRKAADASNLSLPDRVGTFHDNLTRVDGQYGAGDDTETLVGCVNYLRSKGLDVDVPMARLAIAIYTERNTAIDRDIGRLPQILPEDQTANREILERLMHFYGDSADLLRTHDRTKVHHKSSPHQLPSPKDPSDTFSQGGLINMSPGKIRSVSPSKRTASGSSKSVVHLSSTSYGPSMLEEEGLHAYEGILEDIAKLRSKGGSKAIEAIEDARKLLRQVLDNIEEDEKAATMEEPQHIRKRRG